MKKIGLIVLLILTIPYLAFADDKKVVWDEVQTVVLPEGLQVINKTTTKGNINNYIVIPSIGEIKITSSQKQKYENGEKLTLVKWRSNTNKTRYTIRAAKVAKTSPDVDLNTIFK